MRQAGPARFLRRPLPSSRRRGYLGGMILSRPLPRTAALRRRLPALLAAGLLVLAMLMPPAAWAQSTTGALVERLQAAMDRPMTPPEAWGATAAARSLLPEVRDARTRWAESVAAALSLPSDSVREVLPPLGRGTLSAMPEDPRTVLTPLLGRAMTPAEMQAVEDAGAARDAALLPHRMRLADTLARLSDLPARDILLLLPGVGL